jgi:hypothetical protein
LVGHLLLVSFLIWYSNCQLRKREEDCTATHPLHLLRFASDVFPFFPFPPSISYVRMPTKWTKINADTNEKKRGRTSCSASVHSNSILL